LTLFMARDLLKEETLEQRKQRDSLIVRLTHACDREVYKKL
jgi:hypothetical protein